jgi:hypothetical protein
MTAALLAMLALAAPAPVSCRTGATLAALPGVRIIAVTLHDHSADHNTGYVEYACTSRSARPLRVGVSEGAGGAFQEDTLRYAVAGRYLAAGTLETDEGGGEVTVSVWDLRTRRRLVDEAQIEGDDSGDPLIRLGTGGDVIDPEGDVLLVVPGHRTRRLSNGEDTDEAVAGSTLYWTAAGQAREMTLPGPASRSPDTFADLPDGALYRSHCRSRPGRDVARDGWLRVARGPSGWFACQVTSRQALRLPANLRPRSVRIAHQRWLYYAAGGSGHVVDMRTRTRVATVPAPSGVQPLLLDDGRVAWIDAGGTLMVQRPGAPAVALATGASALAVSGSVLYWTSAGVPHRG